MKSPLLAVVIIIMISVVYMIVVGQPDKPSVNETSIDDTSPFETEIEENINVGNTEKYPDVFRPDIESMMNLEGMKKNAPAFSFTDESVFTSNDEENFHSVSSNGVEQYMSEQLLTEPGKKFRISTGYNQLGAVKPVNSLGEQIKLSSISTVF